MHSFSSSPRVVVVGGGILGISTAAQLATRGAEVTLVTESTLSSGASGRSLSWLNSAGQRSPEYHALRMAGIDRYRTLLASTPSAGFVRFDGALTWARPGASYVDRHRHERSIGYDSRWLSAEEVGDGVPGVEVDAVHGEGAIFNPGEGWVDLPLLGAHLVGVLRAHGGRVVEDAGRASVRVERGSAVGVTLADGSTFEADRVVLATGPWVPRDLQTLGVELGSQTPTSLLVATKPLRVPLRAVLNTPRVAMRPTPFGNLVLDSGWSEDEIVHDADGGFEVLDSTVEGLLREAERVLAGSPKLELQSYAAGPKPIPADGDPVIGALEQVPGLHVLFTHSGATLALIAGELVAEELVSGEPSPLLGAFNAARFFKDPQ